MRVGLTGQLLPGLLMGIGGHPLPQLAGDQAADPLRDRQFARARPAECQPPPGDSRSRPANSLASAPRPPSSRSPVPLSSPPHLVAGPTPVKEVQKRRSDTCRIFDSYALGRIRQDCVHGTGRAVSNLRGASVLGTVTGILRSQPGTFCSSQMTQLSAQRRALDATRARIHDELRGETPGRGSPVQAAEPVHRRALAPRGKPPPSQEPAQRGYTPSAGMPSFHPSGFPAVRFSITHCL